MHMLKYIQKKHKKFQDSLKFVTKYEEMVKSAETQQREQALTII
jgi:hypothetical protein